MSDPPKRKPGRPRKSGTRSIHVRISDAVYLAYKRQAEDWLEPLGTVLRAVLTTHAPVAGGNDQPTVLYGQEKLNSR